MGYILVLDRQEVLNLKGTRGGEPPTFGVLHIFIYIHMHTHMHI